MKKIDFNDLEELMSEGVFRDIKIINDLKDFEQFLFGDDFEDVPYRVSDEGNAPTSSN